MSRLDCISLAQPWLMLPFVIGTIILTYLIAKQNKLGFKDALLAAAGLKRISRTPFIIIFHALILIVPLLLFLWQLGECDPTLF